MNHDPLVLGTLPAWDKSMVCAQRASSGKQEVQTDGRAEGAKAPTPASLVGPGLSTTAAQHLQACHRHQRNFKVGFEGRKLYDFGNFERETLLSEHGAWTIHVWHGKEGAATLIDHEKGCEGP